MASESACSMRRLPATSKMASPCRRSRCPSATRRSTSTATTSLWTRTLALTRSSARRSKTNSSARTRATRARPSPDQGTRLHGPRPGHGHRVRSLPPGRLRRPQASEHRRPHRRGRTPRSREHNGRGRSGRRTSCRRPRLSQCGEGGGSDRAGRAYHPGQALGRRGDHSARRPAGRRGGASRGGRHRDLRCRAGCGGDCGEIVPLLADAGFATAAEAPEIAIPAAVGLAVGAGGALLFQATQTDTGTSAATQADPPAGSGLIPPSTRSGA